MHGCAFVSHEMQYHKLVLMSGVAFSQGIVLIIYNSGFLLFCSCVTCLITVVVIGHTEVLRSLVQQETQGQGQDVSPASN